jgi:autophagy-related protein 13
VYQAPDSSRVRIEPTPRYILLESWLLAFSPGSGSTSAISPASSSRQPQCGYGEGDNNITTTASTSTTSSSTSSSTSSTTPEVAPSTIYKHGITLFRSLFSLLRILPTWKLYKRLRRRTGGGNRNANLGIRLRVRGVGGGTGGGGTGRSAEWGGGVGDESILGFGE